MRFLVDAQLPPALAKALNKAGHQARHVSQAKLLVATDREIWRHAVDTNAVLITKDEDFSVMRSRLKNGPAVVWIRLGNTSNRSLTETILPMLPDIVDAINAGETIIEVR